METITKTRKIGGSLVVTIPKAVVDEERLRENQTVRIDIRKIRKSGFGISKGLPPFSKEDKFKAQLEE